MENNNNNDDIINSLPEYKIRTMEGDIDKLEKGANLPPEGLPIVVSPKPIEVPKPVEKISSKPIEVPKPVEIPVPKPIETPVVKPVEIPVPKPVDIPVVRPIESPSPKQVKIETPAPKTKPIKTPLPEIEDFIVPVPSRTEKTGESRIEELKKELRVEKNEKLKTEDIFGSKTKTKKGSFWLIVLGVILLIAVILGFFYWQGLKTESNSTPPPATNNEPQIPESLILVENTKILKLENNISLLILLEDELKIEPIKTFRRIVPLKFSAVSGKDEALSLSDLIKELNISVYPYVLSEFKNSYTLVLYGQEENEKRLGLIVEINNSDNVKTQSKFWEETMVENLYNLFLGKQPQIPTNKSFSDSNYNGSAIRFINFPNPDVSIDYAVLNNLFILSTSKESIRAIIDRIK